MDNTNDQSLTKKQRRDMKRQAKLQARDSLEQQRRRKSILTWSMVIIVIVASVGGIIWAASVSDPSSDRIVPEIASVTPADHVKGAADAKVTLVEYSDFQCPACGFYFPLVQQLAEDYADRLRVVYRHFPITSKHKNAESAAYAAEAASAQGKFWEMHDMLFENQDSWGESSDAQKTFESYAEKIGLDVEKFKTDAVSRESKEKVDADVKVAVGGGVDSTPSFFLNGKSIDNPSNYEDFKQRIEKALQENS